MPSSPSQPPHLSGHEPVADLLFTVDQNLRITAISGPLLPARGIAPGKLAGAGLPQLQESTGVAVEPAAVQRALAGELVTLDWANGEGPSGQITLAPVSEPDGAVRSILGAVRLQGSPGDRSTQKYGLLAGMTTDAVLFLRAGDGAILEANEAAAALYGYNRDELRALTLHHLIHPATPEAEREDAVAANRFEATHRRADGGAFAVEVSTTGGQLGSEPVVLYLVRDITQRRRQEQVQGLIYQLNERILANTPLAAVLHLACEQLVQIYELPLVWVGGIEPKGPTRLMASAGPATELLRSMPIDLGSDGPGGPPDRSGKLRVLDLLEDPALADRFGDHAAAIGVRWVMAIPLFAQERVVGTLSLYRPASKPFDGATTAELRHLASQLGLCWLSAQHQAMIHLQSTALGAAANAVLIADRDGGIQWVNPAFTALTGYTFEEVHGRKPSMLRSGNHTDTFYRGLWETVLAGEPWRGHMYNRRKDGSIYVEEMTVTPVRDPGGNVTNFVAIKQDITERRRQEERIEYLATHDFLTGLLNRAGLHSLLERAVERGRRGRQSALVMLDLDNFKLVNDTVGHPAGDQLLISIARQMIQAARPSDEVARLGGDEFAILLDGADLTEAQAIAEQVRLAVDGYRFHWGGHVFTLTASLGIAVIDGTLSGDEVLALSDAALYEAKQFGKNRVTIRSGSDRKGDNLAAARWMARIKDALAEEQFELHYQAVTRLNSGERWHVEALVRMRDEYGSLIPPGHFIPIAERFGMMPAIDRYVIRKAMESLAANPGLRIFINLSGLTLSDNSLAAFVRQAIDETGVNPADICFEVTETAALLDLTHAQDRMRELKDMGCRFALDDFGAGFASFAYLRNLPVDYLKLDGSFTRQLDSNGTNRALAKAVVEIARVLGKEVIAEQVERKGDADVLRELGVEYGQGFLWGRPAPLDD